jgi:hypothetical protein
LPPFALPPSRDRLPLGFVLRRRLDFLPRVVDVDVFVLVPPFLRPAAPLLA